MLFWPFSNITICDSVNHIFAVSDGHRFIHHQTLQARRRSQAKNRMADDDRRLEWAATVATKDGNRENQTCNRGDIKATREGEETPKLDLKGRGTGRRPGKGRRPPSWTWGTGETIRRPGRGRRPPSWTGGTRRRPGRGRRPPSWTWGSEQISRQTGVQNR